MDRRHGAIADAARADLVDRLGSDRVSWTPGALAEAGAEDAIAVARPVDATQLSALMRIAKSRRVSLVPAWSVIDDPERAAHAVVVDTQLLDQPPAVDIGRRVVTAGAGVPIGRLDEAARPARLGLRTLPLLDVDLPVGALLTRGEPGVVGLARGSLAREWIAAEVVTGAGRHVQLGASALLGQPPWLDEGLGTALGALVGGSGRLALLVSVSLRLHRRAASPGWSQAPLGAEQGGARDALLSLLGATRGAFADGQLDTVVVDEGAGTCWVRHAGGAGAALQGAARDALSVRLGVALQPSEGPTRVGDGGPRPFRFELRVAWSDLPRVLDVSDALIDRAAARWTTQRTWAAGDRYVRLAHLWTPRADAPPLEHVPAEAMTAELRRAAAIARQHPLLSGAQHLLDARALPIGVSPALRSALRDRLSPSGRVLLTAIGRAWDPEGLVAPRAGVL